MTEKQRAERNLNPHAEARIAMIVWGKRYAAQPGGSMDFWDSLTETEREMCRDWAERIRESKPELR